MTSASNVERCGLRPQMRRVMVNLFLLALVLAIWVMAAGAGDSWH